MKFEREDLATKKFDELNIFLTEKINENPLNTAKIILNTALKLRQPSDSYSENILFFKRFSQFCNTSQEQYKNLRVMY